MDAKVFSWIFLTTVLWTAVLPGDSFNPWASLDGKVNLHKIARFACQLAVAGLTASQLPTIFGEDVRFSFPSVRRCSEGGAHASSLACETSGFSGGPVPLGAIGNEAAHTAVLNVVLGLLAPRVGRALLPFVVAAAVVATIRSPWSTTGPALNLTPAAASFALHRDGEVFAWHWVGTYLGISISRQVLGLFAGRKAPAAVKPKQQ